MADWLQPALTLREAGEAFVLVTVAATRGSAPRETGAKMIVTRDRLVGTIGGGRLEHECARIAATWLREPAASRPRAERHRYPLGASFGQCCGGIVQILFEEVRPDSSDWLPRLADARDAGEPCVLVTALEGDRRKRLCFPDAPHAEARLPAALAARCRELLRAGSGPEQWTDGGSGHDFLLEPLRASAFTVVLFGAGHVGTALVGLLKDLDCTVHWVDSRADLLERPAAGDVRLHATDEPRDLVALMPPGSFYLVMTHSHPLDLEICAAVLARDDAAYCGLIGSRAKRRRFEKQFRALGITEERIAWLTCPIGIEGIDGKRPAEIAVAVTAELLREQQRRAAGALGSAPRRQGTGG